ncbi:MAG TPA: MlaD family protein [Marmoricola sp.]|nr:MlaD family protein [Marmoricola sp.]
MLATSRNFAQSLRPKTKRSKGIALIVVLAAILVALGFKNQITLFFRSGDTIHAIFARNYDIIPGQTKVKMAGLQVGVVSGMTRESNGTTDVSLKVDHGIEGKLGSNPQARVEPLTVLGGEYAVELIPSGSGSFGGTIPTARTHTPVELDQILDALPASARTGLQNTVKEAGDAFSSRKQASLNALAKESTTVMAPSGQLITAVRGNQSGTDIPNLVTNLERMSAGFNSQQNALARSFVNLDTVTRTLAAESPALTQAIANLPGALSATNEGTHLLQTTLTKLGNTSTALLPTAQRVLPLLNVLEPTLKITLPVAEKLPSLLKDAQPLVANLVPIASNADAVVNDFKGPVISRVQNPILSVLGHTYRGTGAFADTGGGVQANNKFYQEIGYMVTNLDRASMTHDAQGALLNFQAGVSVGTLAPLNLDDALAALLPALKGK